MTARRGLRFVLLALMAPACLQGGSADVIPDRTPFATPTQPDSRVIGLVATFSGDRGFGGEDAFEGADLGVHILNREAEPDERRFELVALDDQGDPARAIRLVRELAASERTAGVVYGGPPEALPRAEDALARAGIPAVLCYGDLYGARRLRPHLFQASPPFLWQARRLVRYLLQDRGYARIGALVEDSPTGATALAGLSEALREIGRPRPAVARYAPGRQDLDGELRALERRRVEAILLQASPATMASVVAGLRSLGALYRSTDAARIASASRRVRRRRIRRGLWRPQVAAFDLAVGPLPAGSGPPPGTVAAETYARGAHYLPVPSFVGFRRAFADWWDSRPLGLERRTYEAARMIGWAARRTAPGDDAAETLEQLRGRRFGGLDVVLGPDDHTTVEQTTVGLWVVPRKGARVHERQRDLLPEGLPWVPLARGFSIDGRRTAIPAQDWEYLFRRPPPRSAPAPRFRTMRFGVVTESRDPVH